MTSFTIHPAALIMPRPSEEDRASLLLSIAEEGLHQPIMLCEGMILDGVTRAGILEELDATGTHIEPRYENFTGTDPISYVKSVNCNRRQLNTTQKLCIAADWLDLVRAGEVAFVATPGIKTRDAVAQRFGIRNGRQLDAVARVKREAEPLYEAMASGGLSLGRAEVELGYRKPATAPPVPPGRAALVEWGRDVMVRAAVRYGKVSDDWEAVPDAIDALMKELLNG